MPKAAVSTVLTIRVPTHVERRLAREARRLRLTRSEVARYILEAGLPGAPQSDPAAEARRQSALASAHATEREALRFLSDFADLRGWE
jgi:predicted transcriptional regulator